jgi:hypothetical protein
MWLWKYILKADDRADLADPDRGYDWFRQRHWVPMTVGPDGERVPNLRRWSDAERREWTSVIHALRSLARRITSTRPRRCTPNGEGGHRAADELFRRYLHRLRLDPVGVLDVRGRGRGLFRRPVKLRLLPTSDPTRARPGERCTVANPIAEWANLDIFFQSAVASLVVDEIESVCEECGTPFDPTQRGRQSRRSVCAKCSFQRWRRKRGTAGLRELWKSQKRQQRKRQQDKSLATGLGRGVDILPQS